MKQAKIKATGEIHNIADWSRVTLESCNSYGDPIELGFDEVEILEEKTSDIDWEHRRYELSKSIIKGISSNINITDISKKEYEIVNASVSLADKLISRLKKGK